MKSCAGTVRCSVAPFTKDTKPVLCGVGVDPDQLPLLVNFPGGEALTCEEDFGELKSSITGFESARLLFHLPPYQPVKKTCRDEGEA